MNTHATIEQLVELKDDPSHAMHGHVESCDVCQYELQTLLKIKDDMVALAYQKPDAALWARIQATVAEQANAAAPRDQVSDEGMAPISLLAAQQSRSSQQPLSRAIYTLAASILVTGFIGLYLFSSSSSNRTDSELLHASIQQLMINSHSMEQALQKVALQSELLTASQRSEADRLYWQLAYLDQMIHDVNVDSQANPQRVEVLWNNRIEALSELNQLYYQRQQALTDSEI